MADLAAGRFEFLGVTRVFEGGVDWACPDASQLWRFHLHSFEYVESILEAADAQADAAFALFRSLVVSWDEANRRLLGDGWESYTLSLRIVNWLKAWSAWHERMREDPAFAERFLGCIYAQAAILRTQLERDLRGNHLLENARALVWAGVAFEGVKAAGWFDTGMRILRVETTEQILADGGHFERTPGYHVLMLARYHELGDLLQKNAGACPEFLTEAVRHMASFLEEILPPDGRLPLFKDTVLDANHDPASTLAAARAWLISVTRTSPFTLSGGVESASVRTCPRYLPATGYLVFEGSSDYIVLDAGTVGPAYLPGHAHADTFSFEYSLGGTLLVVDSGVFEYAAGPWREFFRSTRAHNTLEIDGQDSSEMWDSFRVGRRAAVQVEQWLVNGDSCILVASHDGYRHLAGAPTVRRCFFWIDGECLAIIESVVGTELHVIRSYVHFHPAFILPPELLNGFRATSSEGEFWFRQDGFESVRAVSGLCASPIQGWYSERFGARVSNQVLILESETRLPFTAVYIIGRSPSVAVAREFRSDGVLIRINTSKRQAEFLVTDHGISRTS